ncbi:hypothetical protein BFP72_04075 [Reichenbachiella sp. 5M10]|uniref:sugar transferase n=1 Tax=Reichenbachiella sp. 5M10 TaxID=1889772 RepID=UPI000C15D21C|nr:sugar transferase [Reichenbachiella sp. 5M10]PIB34644.1 hypothetical protein BFP72_04075 [Reichenbachiella sp. 5M10]
MDAIAEPDVIDAPVQNSKIPLSILYLGSEILSNLEKISSDDYTLSGVESARELIRSLHNWTGAPPEAILIHDTLASQLLPEDVYNIKKKNSFRNITIIVFSNVENQRAKNYAEAIKADEYIHSKIKFSALIPRIKFCKRLRAAGFSRQDSILKKNKKYKMYFLKRFFDITVSSSILLLSSPIMVLTAIIIKLESKGPVFYISKRAGTNYQVFDFYKFRSMNQGADKQLESLKQSSNQYQDGNQFVKIKDDPRVTKFGNFIRNTSIDELPQLINVLKGDMSIVGNRPLPLYEAQLLTTDDHAERFLGPAGITGLWQTMKRGKDNMSSEERIMLDRIYVRKNSLFFDFKLMLLTVPALIQSEKV